MRHKILVPTDFSQNAIKAFRYAIELFKHERTDFYLLNVFSIQGNIIEGLINSELGGEWYETRKLESSNGLAEFYGRIVLTEDKNPKHNFKTISVFNNTLDAIKDVVEQKDIEMIVMGTRGENYSDTNVFGSTATYVMEKIRSCPVIVVPLHAKTVMPKEIVFPTDFKTFFKSRELRVLIQIAKKSLATIAVLHLSKSATLDKNQSENKALLEDILEDTSYTFHFLENHKLETALNVFVESRTSDMVAFINKKHSFFGSILTRPLVKTISFHSKVPILVIHDYRY
ncbi:universal stress protein [Winogradskyella rapida]|uniref:Universal stress protein n=1 Tax=Winogradskyella rapida TaxID=549701 RepID=A0ABW3KQT8_9FLAO